MSIRNVMFIGGASATVVIASVVAGASGANAVTPRVGAAGCASLAAPVSGYVLGDPITGASCTVDIDGASIWVPNSQHRKGKKLWVSAEIAPNACHASRNPVKFFFLRGSTVIKKKEFVNDDCIAVSKARLTKKGTWTIFAKKGGKSMATTVLVS